MHFLRWIDDHKEDVGSFEFFADRALHLPEVFTAFPHAKAEHENMLSAVKQIRREN